MHPTKLTARVAAFLAVFVLSAIASAEPVDDVHRILPLGDSITQADAHRASYRYPLWKMLVDEGLAFDFVGSMRRHYGEQLESSPPQPDYKGLAFDRDHEGHFGWTAREIVDGRSRGNGSGSGKLADWVARYDADIALVHLGTNDVYRGRSNEAILDDLGEIIRILRADNPAVVVLLAQIIPAGQDPGVVASLNRALPRMARNMTTSRSPVVIVDHHSGFDPQEDTYDGVHPNESGEKKMARRWFDAIMKATGREQ
jgi:lysophospholipase L1-like esterase